MKKKLSASHKLLRNLKSQAAFEFLITYSWAFLVILITIGALYYFGVFDFAKFLPQRCLFPAQMACIDFAFAGTNVNIKLLNNIGETIDITSFQITNDAVNPLSCTSPSLITGWESGQEKDFVFTGCTDGAFIIGERTDAKITVNYCAPATDGCPVHAIKGKITSVVNP